MSAPLPPIVATRALDVRRALFCERFVVVEKLALQGLEEAWRSDALGRRDRATITVWFADALVDARRAAMASTLLDEARALHRTLPHRPLLTAALLFAEAKRDHAHLRGARCRTGIARALALTDDGACDDVRARILVWRARHAMLRGDWTVARDDVDAAIGLVAHDCPVGDLQRVELLVARAAASLAGRATIDVDVDARRASHLAVARFGPSSDVAAHVRVLRDHLVRSHPTFAEASAS